MKMNWGLIGGGEGSQIGATHRIAAGLDGEFQLAAGALDIDATRAREYALRLGIAKDRAYGDWREMLEAEQSRPDRVALVTVATPNSSHFEITRAFLQAGFDVLCEKPLTTTLEEAEEIVRTARTSGRICAVNYGYSGYALVRHARAMVAGSASSWPNSPMVTTPTLRMRTIRASAGVTIRNLPASPPSSRIAESTPCTWRLSSRDRRSSRCRPTSHRRFPGASSKTMRW